jgi:hypothetical protein
VCITGEEVGQRVEVSCAKMRRKEAIPEILKEDEGKSSW